MNTRKGFSIVALIFFLALAIPSLPASASSPAAVPAGELPTVEVVESTAEALVLDIHIAGLVTSEIQQDGITYQSLNLPYSGATTQVGRPALPTFGRMLAVPEGAQVEVEVLDAAYETLSDVLIYPAQEPQYDCAADRKPPDFAIDQDFYNQDTLYPGQVVMVEDVRSVRGCPVSVVRFFPYQYNPEARELTAYSRLRVRLRFVGAQGPFVDESHRAESFETLYRRLLLNYEQLGAPQSKAAPRSPTGAEFLIISHPDFVAAANDLAAWRNAGGIDTEVRTTNETGSTAAEIKAYIQNAYDTWDPAPEFVMFLGDHEWVPTNIVGSMATDLYYFTVDGGDYYPDIHGGRISVDTLAQAQKAVNDIIDYDQNPVTDQAFYENVSLAAYFQDDEGDGYETRRFVLTSEEIRDYLLAEGYAAERIYYTHAYINPTHYNDGPYANGEPLPPDLLRPVFPWDGDAADITTAVQAGRFLLTHRDHGFPGGWGDPYYDVSHVLALTNGNKLPVVLSMNCQSGQFDGGTDPCFAEAWQRNPNGGAVGVVAATRSSISGYNDWMAEGFIDAIWPDFLPEVIPGFDLPEYRMGVVLNYGKYIMEITWGDPWGYQQLEWELFHYFGDPTMGIHVNPPFADFTLNLTPDTHQVCAPDVVTSTVQIGQILDYAQDVTLEVLDVPAGVAAGIAPMVVTPPGTATLTLDVTGAAADGAYTLVISGTAEMTNVHTAQVELLVSTASPDAPTLLSPPDGAADMPHVGVVFEWSAVDGANSYHLQVDNDPAFGSPEADVTGISAATYTLETALDTLTTYYWRVSAVNGCGEGLFSTTFSFTVKDLPCILLVDDDNNSPDVLPYYTAALDDLGYEYDVFDVGGSGGNGPTASGLQGYSMVFWFSGDKYGGSAGPNGADETELAAYLDGGGKLFLASQDYLFDFGLTTFGQDYLGILAYTSDSGNASTKYGVSGDPIGDGLGPYPLTYPSGFEDYGDIVYAGTGASVAFRNSPSGGSSLDVDKDGGDWQTVFFGTSWVPVYNNNTANGEELLQRIIDWFGGCERSVAGTAMDWTPDTPRVGEQVTFTGTVTAGDPPIVYDWDFGDGGADSGQVATYIYATEGDYTVFLTATNAYGQEAISDTITVLPPACVPVEILEVGTATAGCEVTFTAELTGTAPYTYTWDFGAWGSNDEMTATVDFGLSGTYPYSLTVLNCGGAYSDTFSDMVTVACAPPCVAVEGVTLTLVTTDTLYPDDEALFRADVLPPGATPPFTYTIGGDAVMTAPVAPLTFTLSFAQPGTHTVEIAVWNCAMTVPVTGTVDVVIMEPEAKFYLYLPVIVRDDGS